MLENTRAFDRERASEVIRVHAILESDLRDGIAEGYTGLTLAVHK